MDAMGAIQDSGCGMRDEGGRMNAMDAMGAIQDSGFRLRDEGYEMRDARCEG
jgi:hypothetical protein